MDTSTEQENGTQDGGEGSEIQEDSNPQAGPRKGQQLRQTEGEDFLGKHWEHPGKQEDEEGDAPTEAAEAGLAEEASIDTPKDEETGPKSRDHLKRKAQTQKNATPATEVQKRRRTTTPTTPSNGNRMVTRSRAKADTKGHRIVKTSRHWTLQKETSTKSKKKSKWEDDEEDGSGMEEEDELQIEEEEDDVESEKEEKKGKKAGKARKDRSSSNAKADEAEALLLCNFENQFMKNTASNKKKSGKKSPTKSSNRESASSKPKPKASSKRAPAKKGKKSPVPDAESDDESEDEEADAKPQEKSNGSKKRKQPAGGNNNKKKKTATNKKKSKKAQITEEEDNAKSLGLLAAAVFFQEGEDLEEEEEEKDAEGSKGSAKDTAKEIEDAAAMAAEEQLRKEKEERKKEIKRNRKKARKIRKSWIGIDKIRGDEELQAAFVEKTRKFIIEIDLEMARKKDRLQKAIDGKAETQSKEVEAADNTEQKAADGESLSEKQADPSEDSSASVTADGDNKDSSGQDQTSESTQTKDTPPEPTPQQPQQPQQPDSYDQEENERKLKEVLEMFLVEFKKTYLHTLSVEPHQQHQRQQAQQGTPTTTTTTTTTTQQRISPARKTSYPSLFQENPSLLAQPLSPPPQPLRIIPQPSSIVGPPQGILLQPLQPRPSTTQRIVTTAGVQLISTQQQSPQPPQSLPQQPQPFTSLPTPQRQQQSIQLTQPSQYKQVLQALPLGTQQVIIGQPTIQSTLPLPTIQPLVPSPPPSHTPTREKGTPSDQPPQTHQPQQQQQHENLGRSPQRGLSIQPITPSKTPSTTQPPPMLLTTSSPIVLQQVSSPYAPSAVIVGSPLPLVTTLGVLMPATATSPSLSPPMQAVSVGARILPRTIPQIVPTGTSFASPLVGYSLNTATPTKTINITQLSPVTLTTQQGSTLIPATLSTATLSPSTTTIAPGTTVVHSSALSQPTTSPASPSVMTRDNSSQLVKKNFTFHVQGVPSQLAPVYQTAAIYHPFQPTYATSIVHATSKGISSPAFIHTTDSRTPLTNNSHNTTNPNKTDDLGQPGLGSDKEPSNSKEDNNPASDGDGMETDTVEESGEVVVGVVVPDKMSDNTAAKRMQDEEAESLYHMFVNDQEVYSSLEQERPALGASSSSQFTREASSTEPVPNIAAIQPQVITNIPLPVIQEYQPEAEQQSL